GGERAMAGGPVGSDDGQRDVVPDARSGLRREKVVARGLEEFQHRLVFKRGRIGEVDHHLRAGYGLFEALAGDGVDAAIGRCGEDLVAALAQNDDGLRADQAGAADYDDLHGYSPLPTTGGSAARREDSEPPISLVALSDVIECHA